MKVVNDVCLLKAINPINPSMMLEINFKLMPMTERL